MVLRKPTIDNSVRHIPKIEGTKERDIKPNTKKIFNKRKKMFQKTFKKRLTTS